MVASQKHIITGIIMPHCWDENGKVIEIALYNDKEEVYALEDNRLTQTLLEYMQKTVEIRGNIRKHPDGNKSIAAYGYKIRK